VTPHVLSLLLLANLIPALEGVGARRDSAIAILRKSPDAAVAMLDSTNWRGRDGVVAALESANPPRVDVLFQLASSHPSTATRLSAIRSYSRVADDGGCTEVLRLMNGLGNDDAVILDALRERTDCDPDRIASYLSAEDADVRRRALVLFLRSSSGEAIGRSVSALGDPDRGVRHAASAHLVQAGTSAIPAIIADLPNMDHLARLAVYRVLGHWESDDSERALIQGWDRGEWGTRYVVSESLGRIGGETSLAFLKRASQAEEHHLVQESIRAAIESISIREGEAVGDE